MMVSFDGKKLASAVGAAKELVAAVGSQLTELEQASVFGVVLGAILQGTQGVPGAVEVAGSGKRGRRGRRAPNRTTPTVEPAPFTYDAERYPNVFQLAKLPAIERVLWVMVVEKMERGRELLSAPEVSEILDRSIGVRTGPKTVDEALKRELQRRSGVSRVSRRPKGRSGEPWRWQVTKAGEEHVMSGGGLAQAEEAER